VQRRSFRSGARAALQNKGSAYIHLTAPTQQSTVTRDGTVSTLPHVIYHLRDWRRPRLATLCRRERVSPEALKVIGIESSLFHSLRQRNPEHICWQCYRRAVRILDSDGLSK